jgi:hypothetical protein
VQPVFLGQVEQYLSEFGQDIVVQAYAQCPAGRDTEANREMVRRRVDVTPTTACSSPSLRTGGWLSSSSLTFSTIRTLPRQPRRTSG